MGSFKDLCNCRPNHHSVTIVKHGSHVCLEDEELLQDVGHEGVEAHEAEVGGEGGAELGEGLRLRARQQQLHHPAAKLVTCTGGTHTYSSVLLFRLEN